MCKSVFVTCKTYRENKTKINLENVYWFLSAIRILDYLNSFLFCSNFCYRHHSQLHQESPDVMIFNLVCWHQVTTCKNVMHIKHVQKVRYYPCIITQTDATTFVPFNLIIYLIEDFSQSKVTT